MNQRTLIIVAACLVVLSALAFLGGRSDEGVSATDTLLLPGMRARLDDIEAFQIRTAGNEIAVTLRRTENGWVVDERDAYPADVSLIREGLSALAEAEIIEQKTANPALHDRLGVEAIDIETAAGLSVIFIGDGLDLPEVILGDTEGPSYRYARLAADDQSVLIDSNPDLGETASQWLTAEIIDVRGPRIERVIIAHADGETVDIFKSSVEQSNYEVADIPEGRELQYPGVANVIANTLRDLRLEDVAAADLDAIEPTVTTEFHTYDGLVVTATGTTIDDENWLVFSARVAADFEPGDSPDATDADPDSGDSVDPTAEAAAINDRVGGWRYRIASYQFDQITRRLEDLLSAEVLDEEEEDGDEE